MPKTFQFNDVIKFVIKSLESTKPKIARTAYLRGPESYQANIVSKK